MKTTNSKTFYARIFFLMWVFICIFLFILFTGRVSFIHQFIPKITDSFLVGLSRINGSRYILRLFTSLIGTLLFSLSCTGLGVFILELFWKKHIQKFDTLFELLAYLGTAFLIGEIAISSVFLMLAKLNKFTPAEIVSVMIITYLLGFYSAFRIFKRSPLSKLERPWTNLTDRFTRFLKIVSVSIFFLSLLYSSARLSYDAVGMYFSDAKVIAMTNRIEFFSDVFVVSSLHTGIQYAAIIQIFGDQAARMYSWIGGLIILVISLAIGEKLGLSKRALLFLQVMILTSTVFIDLLGDGKIDLQTSAPMLAAVYWMVTPKQTKSNSGHYFLIGLLAGFSIISRLFNAFLAALFIGLFYLWKIIVHRKAGKWNFSLLIESFVGIGLGVFILIGFHLLANLLIMGDTFAPLHTLSGLNSSIWHYSYNPDDIWIYRVLYPFVVTYVNTPQSLGNITPLFLAFIPAFLSSRVRRNISLSREIKGISIIVAIILILWVVLFFMVVEIRYVLFLWILLLIPVAVLIEYVLNSNDRVFTGLLKFLIMALITFIAGRIIFISIATYSPLDKEGNPQCYKSVLCEFIRPINLIAVKGDRVLALNAYRYYMRPDLLACSSKADEYHLLHDASYISTDAFWIEVFRQGYDYVVYEKNYTELHLLMEIEPNPQETPEWLKITPISGEPGDERVVYRLNAEDPPFLPEKVCEEVSPGLWLVEQTP